MSDSDDLEAIAATEIARLQSMRAENLGNHGTSGPAPADHPSVTISHQSTMFDAAGYYIDAKREPAHPGRIGGVIDPFSIAVHSTDMLPEEWGPLVKAWTERAGDGACANFLLGRDEAHGIVQFVPIWRNANHVGGPGHGVYNFDGADHHPNLCAVGIELHCAGGVKMINGLWRLVENGVAHGQPLPPQDVVQDPQRPGRGWHIVTDYQRVMLRVLIAHLHTALRRPPPGAVARSLGESPPSWAVRSGPRLLGHVDLDAEHRSDPWPATCGFLRPIAQALSA